MYGIDILLAFINGFIALWPIYGFFLAWGCFRLFVKYLEQDRIKNSGINHIDKMSTESFTTFMYGFFHDKGIEVTLAHEDIGYYGAELILTKEDFRVSVHLVISTKPIEIKHIKEAHRSKRYYQCQNAVIISNQEYTPAVRDYAISYGVVLWGRERLIKELLNHRYRIAQVLVS